MSIEGMYSKYGDKYILVHEDGIKYVRWGKIERDLDSIQELQSKLSEAEKKLKMAINILEMVEDNTKMPHKHSDFQVRLHCLAERAREALEKIKADK